LWGRSFVVRTNHYALKFLLDQRLSTPPQHHWVTKLFGYDFTVEFRPGTFNIMADALSRHHDDDAAAHAISGPSFELFAELRREVQENPDLRALRDTGVAQRSTPWRVVDGLILYGNRVFIPEGSPLVPMVLDLAHSAGHEGFQKTLQRLRSEFFIDHDSGLVRDFVRSCAVCQQNKVDSL